MIAVLEQYCSNFSLSDIARHILWKWTTCRFWTAKFIALFLICIILQWSSSVGCVYLCMKHVVQWGELQHFCWFSCKYLGYQIAPCHNSSRYYGTFSPNHQTHIVFISSYNFKDYLLYLDKYRSKLVR